MFRRYFFELCVDGIQYAPQIRPRYAGSAREALKAEAGKRYKFDCRKVRSTDSWKAARVEFEEEDGSRCVLTADLDFSRRESEVDFILDELKCIGKSRNPAIAEQAGKAFNEALFLLHEIEEEEQARCRMKAQRGAVKIGAAYAV